MHRDCCACVSPRAMWNHQVRRTALRLLILSSLVCGARTGHLCQWARGPVWHTVTQASSTAGSKTHDFHGNWVLKIRESAAGAARRAYQTPAAEDLPRIPKPINVASAPCCTPSYLGSRRYTLICIRGAQHVLP